MCTLFPLKSHCRIKSFDRTLLQRRLGNVVCILRSYVPSQCPGDITRNQGRKIIGEQYQSLLQSLLLSPCMEDPTFHCVCTAQSHWGLTQLCFPYCYSRRLKEGITFPFADSFTSSEGRSREDLGTGEYFLFSQILSSVIHIVWPICTVRCSIFRHCCLSFSPHISHGF